MSGWITKGRKREGAVKGGIGDNREGGREEKEADTTRVLTNEQEMKIQSLYSVTLFQISNGVSVKDSDCTAKNGP